VRQHTEGVVGSIIWILLEIYCPFQQRKDFKNHLRIDKVIAVSLVYYFLGHSVLPRNDVCYQVILFLATQTSIANCCRCHHETFRIDEQLLGNMLLNLPRGSTVQRGAGWRLLCTTCYKSGVVSPGRQRFLDEDEIVDIKSLWLVVVVDIFVYGVALLVHEVSVRAFAGAAVYVLHRQYTHVDLMKRNRSQNLYQWQSQRHTSATIIMIVVL